MRTPAIYLGSSSWLRRSGVFRAESNSATLTGWGLA
jgi:hypothetical protein